MNALYVICGLGVASLLAEIVNLKKRLIPFLTFGVAVAIGVFDLEDVIQDVERLFKDKRVIRRA